ncbi:MAG: hypothetical protein EBR02_02715 [Alphaproteobacteria bacterium]|nr:hypothetical protein [Alphaproteobacteria bacterium]
MRDYGLRIQCGIEHEFYLRNADNAPPISSLSLADFHTPHKARPHTFDQSPFLQRLEKEAGAEKYELVLGVNDKTRDPINHTPSTMARAALAYKRMIEKRTPELTQGHAKFWAIDQSVTKETEGSRAGLHINLSLWDTNGNNIFRSPRRMEAIHC